VAKANLIEVYKECRFSLVLRAGLQGRNVNVMRVWSDIFSPDRVWIGAMQVKDQEPLWSLLRCPGTITVIQYDRENKPSKEVSFTFASSEALPFDLDAQGSDPAVEWVRLSGVQYLTRG
jgi:hypothetical protein